MMTHTDHIRAAESQDVVRIMNTQHALTPALVGQCKRRDTPLGARLCPLRQAALFVFLCITGLAGCSSQPDPRDLPMFEGKTVFFPSRVEAETNGAFESCGMCHTDIYNDWRESMHAQAWEAPLFQAIYNEWYLDSSIDCRTCHAPAALIINGYGNEPPVTAGSLTHGVTCVSCHLGVHGEILGPRGAQDAPHASVKMDAFGAIELCDSCHGIEGDELLDNMKREWEETGLDNQGVTCQSCHMPIVDDRPRYNGGEVTSTRRHTFQGGHTAAWLEGVVKLDAELGADEIVVTVTNQKTGHNFPAGCIWRRVHVTTRFIPTEGSELNWVEEYATETKRVLERNVPEVLRYGARLAPGRLEVRVTYRSVNEERAQLLGVEIQERFDDVPVSHIVYDVSAGPDGNLHLIEVERFDKPVDPEQFPLPPPLDPWH